MKDKKVVILIAVIILLLLGLSFAKSRAPKPVDWTPNFINIKTSPYGTYITYELLGDIFEKKNIRPTRMPIYNNLKKDLEQYFYYEDDEDNSYAYQDEEDNDVVYANPDDKGWGNTITDSTKSYDDLDDLADTTSYIFINTQFNADKLDREYLLDFVGMGNNVFISAEVFDENFLKKLDIKASTIYFDKDTTYTLADFNTKKYSFNHLYGHTKFSVKKDTYPVRPLAYNSSKDTVFLELKYGKGLIYLHAIPTAFANINMLKTDKYDFGFRSLSYLPKNSKIIWDEFQTQGEPGEGSSFKIMLQNPPLKLALYIILGGLLLFMIFGAKRIQRPIPVINPPVNSSLEFLGTISNVYYRKKDFRTIAEKRHAYFLDFIRKHYYMPTENINDEFFNVLSAKSGLAKEKFAELFTLYKDIVTVPYLPNDKFLKYNSILEEFYRTLKNK